MVRILSNDNNSDFVKRSSLESIEDKIWWWVALKDEVK